MHVRFAAFMLACACFESWIVSWAPAGTLRSPRWSLTRRAGENKQGCKEGISTRADAQQGRRRRGEAQQLAALCVSVPSVSKPDMTVHQRYAPSHCSATSLVPPRSAPLSHPDSRHLSRFSANPQWIFNADFTSASISKGIMADVALQVC